MASHVDRKRLAHAASLASPLMMIAGFAFALRLALIIATPHFQPNSDPADYDRIASSVAVGHGYPSSVVAAPGTASALRPPGYPYLLALIYFLLGHSWLAGRLLGAALGVIVVLLIYAIGRALWGERRGLIAGGLAAVFPPLIALNGSLLSEPLFVALELSVLLVVLGYQRSEDGLAYPLIAGLLCGAAALTRSVGLLLPIAAVAGLLAAPGRRPRHRLAAAAALILVTCLVVAPWTIRNASVFHGAFIPVSTQDGITAAGTYNSAAAAPGPLKAVWRPPYLVPAFVHLFRDSVDEAQLDRILRHDAITYAIAHPGYVALTAGVNSLRLLSLGPAHALVSTGSYHEMGIPRAARAWVSISAGFIAALAVVALAIGGLRRRGAHAQMRPSGFVWLVPVLMYAGSVPISNGLRYRAPIDPFLLLLAACAIDFALARVQARTL